MDPNNEENKGIDLNGALNNVGTDVTFESERQYTRSFSPKNPSIIEWVIKYSGGYIKGERQAGYVIFGFLTLAVVTIIMVMSGGSSEPTQTPVPADQFVPSHN